jgi:SPW repeat
MVLTQQELHPRIILPGIEDRATAARVSSLVCWASALWFFVSPWTFFGVSEQASGWNGWLVGGAMTIIAMFRLVAPRKSTVFAFINAALAVWTICSPWIFGYTGDGLQTTNTISVGATILGCSVMSGVFSRKLQIERSLGADNSD